MVKKCAGRTFRRLSYFFPVAFTLASSKDSRLHTGSPFAAWKGEKQQG